MAREQGLAIGLNLDDGANTPSVPLGALRRVLMTAEMGPLTGLRQELTARRRNVGDTSRSASVMHVDLDDIDDPDPAQVEHNLQLLLSRIRAMGVNTVFLQAYADPDGNGAAPGIWRLRPWRSAATSSWMRPPCVCRVFPPASSAASCRLCGCHLYGYDLEAEQVQRLLGLALDLWPQVLADLQAFERWLLELAALAEGARASPAVVVGVFGLWRDRAEGSLELQEALRQE